MTRLVPPESSDPSEPLSLRVSVATLVRLRVAHPRTGETLLALERKASAAAGEPGRVRAQPFGGALRLLDPAALRAQIGDFAYDSERSRAEQDFRLLIRPAAWDTLREFCLEHLAQPASDVLDADPARELIEEFDEVLSLPLSPRQYQARALGVVVMDQPAPTHNPRAPGQPTARIYQIYDALLTDSALAQTLLDSSQRHSDASLLQQAEADLTRGGRGRAHAALALPLQPLTQAYLALAPARRAQPLVFDQHTLDGNVWPVLSQP